MKPPKPPAGVLAAAAAAAAVPALDLTIAAELHENFFPHRQQS